MFKKLKISSLSKFLLVGLMFLLVIIPAYANETESSESSLNDTFNEFKDNIIDYNNEHDNALLIGTLILFFIIILGEKNAKNQKKSF